MRSPILLVLGLASTVIAAVPYQQYILAPSSRVQVLRGFNTSVTYDFGKNIAGLVHLDVLSRRGSVGVSFSESSLWVSSAACDATADAGLDSLLVFNITHPGHYNATRDQERGAFRYLTVVNLGHGKVSIKDLWVYFTAMPHWENNTLRAYTGWFHSSDEKLNRVWYAGAYTNQLVTIDPTHGDALIFPDITTNSTVNGTLPWWLNTTISEGTSVLIDGAKRDRLVWSGDMVIAVPGIAVTTSDLVSVRNALDSLFNLQNANGQLPYAGTPFNERGIVSFTYHLYALIGVANIDHWSGDQSYLDGKWVGWKSGLEWAAQQIDSSGLANITAAADWLRFGMGGHNIEANSILFYTLNLGATLALAKNETSTAERWSQLASGIQSAAIPLLWQPSIGLFRDNETTTLAPQDGNAWAVKSGLVTSPDQVAQISESLQARWGAYGAPAPEAANAISPFISGFELEAHFMANRTDAALALVRQMWADFMLDDPRMTNSTFIEGYSVNGELRYTPYKNDARISHAHGWSTGPTSSLTTFVGGIQILSDAGATWAIVPQLGDLSHVDTGFSTSKGQFSSKWSINGTSFRLHISTPKGTTGTVGISIPGNFTKVRLTGGKLKGAFVQGDATGRYWIQELEGGEYEFVAEALPDSILVVQT
ncbi:bacterial alpha-L-rhamnosidase domain protein [Fomes fomentarius]|nr:bacterial alpha-L-rhamnosidase domain protein [Fomes fomentarius]